MSQVQTQEPELESQLGSKLKALRPNLNVIETPPETPAVTEEQDQPQRQERTGRREEREPREPVVKVVENEKGEMTISVPPMMEEAKQIAAEIPKAQRAATRQRYTSMAADIAITTLMAVSSIALIAFAAKGLASKDD